MKLSDGVEQAIHCVTMLSGLSPAGALAASALAEFHGVSTTYLLKHLQALSASGILRSIPGPRGGYRLGKAPGEITLLDVVLAVEGREPAFRCAEIRQRGPNPLPARFYKGPCAINAAMLKAEQAYRAELRKITIADLTRESATPLGAAINGRACAFFETHERRQSVSA